MKVILQQDVKGQGKKGDIVNVSDGYARNYLFPNRLAVEATASGVNSINLQKQAADHKREVEKKEAQELAKKINDITVVIPLKVSETGKIFGALTSQMISEALGSQGMDVDKKKIVLSEPIKSIGEHTVNIKLYAEVSAKLRIKVEKQ